MKLINNNQNIIIRKPTNTEKKEELSRLILLIGDSKAKLKELSKDIELESAELDNKIKMSTELDKKLIEYRNDVNSKANELNKLNTEFEELTIKLNDSKIIFIKQDKILKNKLNEVSNVQSKVEDNNKQLFKIKDSIEVLNNESNIKEKILKEYESNINLISSKIKNKEEELKNIEIDINTLKTSQKNKKEDINKLDSRINEKEDSIKILENKIGSLNKTIEKLNDDIYKSNLKIENNKSVLTEVKERQKELKVLESNIVDTKVEINKKQSIVDKAIEKINTELDKKNEEITNINSEIQSKNEELKTINQKITTQTEKLDIDRKAFIQEKEDLKILSDRVSEKERKLAKEKIHIEDTRLSLAETLATIKRKYRLEKIDITV